MLQLKSEPAIHIRTSRKVEISVNRVLYFSDVKSRDLLYYKAGKIFPRLMQVVSEKSIYLRQGFTNK